MARCSVVVPGYNVESFVDEAIESILAQTYRSTEVIVVNDGSTDGTTAAMRPYRDRIVYLEQENLGPSAARNRGILAASGEYIALFDADDVHSPTRLERLVDLLESHRELGVATSMTSTRRPPWRRFRTKDQKFWITQYNFVSSRSVIRRELFDRHGLMDESLRACEDWELWIRFLAGGERIGLVPERLGPKRRRAGSITADWRRNLRNEPQMLERVAGKGYRLPGLEGRLDCARGKVALLDGDVQRGRVHFASATGDRRLPPSTRMLALPFRVAPRTA